MKRWYIITLCLIVGSASVGAAVAAGRSPSSAAQRTLTPGKAYTASALHGMTRLAALTPTESQQVSASGITGVQSYAVVGTVRLLYGTNSGGQSCEALSLDSGNIVTAFDCRATSVKAWSFSTNFVGSTNDPNEAVVVAAAAFPVTTGKLSAAGVAAASNTMKWSHGAVVLATVPANVPVSISGVAANGNAFTQGLDFGFPTN
jgi:hypothetical protein